MDITAQKRIAELESALRAVVLDILPRVHDTGHNAADRNTHQAILLVRKALSAK
jgi:hypothetical protein